MAADSALPIEKLANEATQSSYYAYWSSEQVRFADLDMLGHVNNVAFTTYVESGRAAFLRAAGLWVPGGSRHSVVARLELDYRREIHYPCTVRLGLRVLRIGERSYSLAQGLFDGETCVATAVVVVVRFDARLRQTVTLDAQERAALQGYLQPQHTG